MCLSINIELWASQGNIKSWNLLMLVKMRCYLCKPRRFNRDDISHVLPISGNKRIVDNPPGINSEREIKFQN